MKKMKKAIFGIGLGKEERQARREQRQSNREMRREERQLKKEVCRGGKCGGRAKGYVGYEKGGKMKKAQTGDLLTYRTPGGRITMDTTGYAAGKKKFPTKAEGQEVGLYGRMKPATVYGMTKRKGATRAIARSQGKPSGRVTMTPSAKAKKAFTKSKSGSKISKKK